MKATADIVIVNWNAGQQLKACIKSVQEFGASTVKKCIVVDNGSTDGSAEFLADMTNIELVDAGRNLGFGRACNLGAARGDSPFILFLNPDAQLMMGSLDHAIAYLTAPQNASVGIVGVQLVGEDGQVQRTCAHAPTPSRLIAKSLGLTVFFKSWDMRMKAWDHATSRQVDQVMGAFFVVRRSLFEQIGRFDERFFVYFEEVDLSVRAVQQGFKTMYLAHAQAYHKGGGVSEQVKARRLFYSLRSRLQYAFKHFSRPSAVSVAAAVLFIEPLARFAFLTATVRTREIGDFLNGYRMLWIWVLSRRAGK